MAAVQDALLSMDEVRDEVRSWLSLRQWSILIERNGTGYNVEAGEFGTSPKATRNQFKFTPPLRRIAFHVAGLDDVAAGVDKHDAARKCQCGCVARVSDEATGDSDQTFKCGTCGRQWPA